MPALYKDKGRNTWMVTYSINGRRFRCSAGTSDRAEAELFLKQRFDEHAQGRAASKDPTGYVYVLKSHGLYKIGKTKNPKQRIETINALNAIPVKIILIKTVINFTAAETRIHSLFQDKHVRGEWFRLDESDLDLITIELSRMRFSRKALEKLISKE